MGSKEDNKQLLKRKLYPAMLGGIVGDALGVPVEFKNRDSFKVTEMTGYGTYNQPPGTWSDDTSLTMCLVENILENEDDVGLMHKFAHYRDNGYWTPYGKMFDIGIATNEAIYRYKQGLPLEEWGGSSEYDNGNGALMRIAPLFFTLIQEKSVKKRIGEIKRIAEVTHRHPRSTLGCILYLEFMNALYNDKTPLEANRMLSEFCQEHIVGTVYENEIQHYARLLESDLVHLHRGDIKSDGYVVHSLEAAVWCLLHADDYADAVLMAVNLGNDTDTVALLTGVFAGMYYEMHGIPTKWIEQLAGKKKILDTLDHFYLHCAE
ncbi:ADP-ribosylglycohydrolase family protein [Priestia flexa]|uniref:ADP-ribosylglycohydrolase family protein n=1 Tax=Priestia TaxID=2800373 RepID=UPI0026CC6FB6